MLLDLFKLRKGCAPTFRRYFSYLSKQASKPNSLYGFSGRIETLETRQVLNAGPIDVSSFDSDIVYVSSDTWSFNGEKSDAFEVSHSDDLALSAGTVSLEFSVEQTEGRQTLFSKDHSGYQQGGHITAWVVDDHVEVRLQSDTESVKLYSAVGSIIAGETHQVAVSFGAEGARLYVDGLIADAKVDFSQGIAPNDNSLVLGASTVTRDGDRQNLKDPLAGEITSFVIYDGQLSEVEFPLPSEAISNAAVDLAVAEL